MALWPVALIGLSLVVGCRSQLTVREDTHRESMNERPQAAFCALDLAEWKMNMSHSGFVSSEIATQALRPAVQATQKRICDCLQHWSGRPTTFKFRLKAYPNQGRTTIEQNGPNSKDSLSECIGSLEATYPAFDFRGDLLISEPQPYQPQSLPASFVYPIEFLLE